MRARISWCLISQAVQCRKCGCCAGAGVSLFVVYGVSGERIPGSEGNREWSALSTTANWMSPQKMWRRKEGRKKVVKEGGFMCACLFCLLCRWWWLEECTCVWVTERIPSNVILLFVNVPCIVSVILWLSAICFFTLCTHFVTKTAYQFMMFKTWVMELIKAFLLALDGQHPTVPSCDVPNAVLLLVIWWSCYHFCYCYYHHHKLLNECVRERCHHWNAILFPFLTLIISEKWDITKG